MSHFTPAVPPKPPDAHQPVVFRTDSSATAARPQLKPHRSYRKVCSCMSLVSLTAC